MMKNLIARILFVLTIALTGSGALAQDAIFSEQRQVQAPSVFDITFFAPSSFANKRADQDFVIQADIVSNTVISKYDFFLRNKATGNVTRLQQKAQAPGFVGCTPGPDGNFQVSAKRIGGVVRAGTLVPGDYDISVMAAGACIAGGSLESDPEKNTAGAVTILGELTIRPPAGGSFNSAVISVSPSSITPNTPFTVTMDYSVLKDETRQEVNITLFQISAFGTSVVDATGGEVRGDGGVVSDKLSLSLPNGVIANSYEAVASLSVDGVPTVLSRKTFVVAAPPVQPDFTASFITPTNVKPGMTLDIKATVSATPPPSVNTPLALIVRGPSGNIEKNLSATLAAGEPSVSIGGNNNFVPTRSGTYAVQIVANPSSSEATIFGEYSFTVEDTVPEPGDDIRAEFTYSPDGAMRVGETKSISVKLTPELAKSVSNEYTLLIAGPTGLSRTTLDVDTLVAGGTELVLDGDFIAQEEGTYVAFVLQDNIAIASGNPIVVGPALPIDPIEDQVREETNEVISDLLQTRARIITQNGPAADRRLNRLTGRGANGPALSFEGTPLVSGRNLPFAADISRNGDASFSFSALGATGQTSGPGSTDFWVEGSFGRFNSRGDGDFTILNFGLDHMMNQNLLVGLGAQFDWIDATYDTGSVAEGNGYLIGPYMTARLSENLFFDGRVAWGEADNTIGALGITSDDIGSERFLATAALFGEFSPEGSVWLVRPELRVSYFKETMDSYTNSLGIDIDTQSVELGEMDFGTRFSRDVETDLGLMSPYFGVEGIWTFANESSDAGADAGDVRARLEGGTTLQINDASNASVSLFYDGVGSDTYESWGGRLSYELKF